LPAGTSCDATTAYHILGTKFVIMGLTPFKIMIA
jgi:hypothetical protein